MVATYGEGKLKLYRDGVLEAEIPSQSPVRDFSCDLMLGQLNPRVNERHFSGMIDEFALHPRVLSSEEISARVEMVRGE